METIEKKPLVSVIVITYNSANYVLETLESVKIQTYQNIELIISDDCSTDDTVAVCKAWLKKNKERFVNTKIITVKENTGIPKNCNRGLYAAKGEWVKTIAGDDALMPNCIRDNIEFVQSNADIKFCFSRMFSYRNKFKEEHLIERDDTSQEMLSIKFSELSPKLQLQVMVRRIVIYGATTFYRKEALKSIGGYDETYKFIEDWPTWYNWLKEGEKIYYLPKVTVKYREHSQSITNHKSSIDIDFSDFRSKVRSLIETRFLCHYTLKEIFFYKIEYSYYDYFKNNNSENLFKRIIQRAWYFLVQLSILQRDTYVDKRHSNYVKNNFREK